MTTSTLHHRPAPFIAAAAVVAAIAAGSVAVAVSHQSDQPGAPGQQPQTTLRQETPRGHHSPATTSGGHVMIGL